MDWLRGDKGTGNIISCTGIGMTDGEGEAGTLGSVDGVCVGETGIEGDGGCLRA